VQDERFFGTAHTLEPAACDAHFRAKVHGFHVLQSLLDEHTTRRVTLSSLSAILGGLGFGPYAAANAALDACALAARDDGRGSWLTVDWEAWQSAPASGAEEARRTGVSGFELTAQEGADIFDRAIALADQLGQLVVSTGPLQGRLDQWVTRPPSRGEAPDSGAGERLRDPRPALPTPYVAPSAGAESVLAEIWAEVLGLDRVGADDDFYRLGGNSITAIDLTARVRKQMQVAVPVTALLENPSVRQLAIKIAMLAPAAA
jgi:phthiocerol/phenolphthiocerol synthesis type-I polyketide synthase E